MREWASLATQPIGLDKSSKAGNVGCEWCVDGGGQGGRPGIGQVFEV